MTIKTDPTFQNVIPPLTEEEYSQLRDNILSDGEVYEPIITWNGTNGREDTRETDIRLYQTYSIFRAHFGAPGVKLKYIEFVFRCSPEEDTTFEL